MISGFLRALRWAPAWAASLGAVAERASAFDATPGFQKKSAPAADQVRSLEPEDPVRTSGRLSNGLQYVLHSIKSSDKAISVRLVVGVGTDDEEERQYELSHLVEHIIASPYNKGPVANFLRSTRISQSAWNASTGLRGTIYRLDVTSESLPNSEMSITNLVKDILSHPLVDSASLNAEKGTLAEELEAGRAADWRNLELTITQELFGSRVKSRGNYTYNNVAQFTERDVQEWLARWYRPNRTSLVVVGDIDIRAWQDAIEATLGELRNFNGPAEVRKPLPEPKFAEGVRVLPVGSDSASPYSVEIFGADNRWRVSDRGRGRTSYSALVLEEFSRKLLENRSTLIRRSTGQSVSISSLLVSQVSDDLPFLEGKGFRASVRAESKDDVLNKVYELGNYVGQIARSGFSDPEIERARRLLLADLAESPRSISEVATDYALSFAAGKAAIQPVSDEGRRAQIASVRAQKVRDFVRDKMKLSQSIGIVITAPNPRSWPTGHEELIQRRFLDGFVAAPMLTVQYQPMQALGKKAAEWQPTVAVTSRNISDSARMVRLGGADRLIIQRSSPGEGPMVSAIGSPLDLPANDWDIVTSFEGALNLTGTNRSDVALGEFLTDHRIAARLIAGRDYSVIQVSARPGSEAEMLQVLRSILLPAHHVKISFVPDTIRIKGQVPSISEEVQPFIDALASAMAGRHPRRGYVPHYVVMISDSTFQSAEKAAFEYLTDIPFGQGPVFTHGGESKADGTEGATRWKEYANKRVANFFLSQVLDLNQETRVKLAVLEAVIHRAIFNSIRSLGADYSPGAKLFMTDIGRSGSKHWVYLVPLLSVGAHHEAEADRLIAAIFDSRKNGELGEDEFKIAKSALLSRWARSTRRSQYLADYWTRRVVEGNPTTSTKSDMDYLQALSYEQARTFISTFFRNAVLEYRN